MRKSRLKGTLTNALTILSDFKGASLKEKISELENQYKGKRKSDVIATMDEFRAAKIIKDLSAQINEVVHALGILNCLPKILKTKERIVSLSLASSAAGKGIDLVTNKRIAEFKFSAAYAGMQVRHVFSDFVSLTIFKPETNQTEPRRQLYVFNAKSVINEMQNSNANCFKRLSKSGKVADNLRTYLTEIGSSADTVKEIYELSYVEIIDIETVLSI